VSRRSPPLFRAAARDLLGGPVVRTSEFTGAIGGLGGDAAS